ncbi:TPA: hypothetical protein RSW02_002662, partial [Mannheimia haemolytica]|nr:hypothetical protein [Mannheimia haemolytica]HDZ3679764.1 hypothetical protein [Mannheimia haemolytica]HDZ6709342.1 hypothetical protein [Mannheimia haemolytica]
EDAAKFFNSYFINKKVIYRTKTQEISIIFKRSNFMHLCGIKYTDGASEFFNAAISNNLDLAKMNVKSDGTTFLKLSLLNSVSFLLTPEMCLTEGGIYLNIRFDKSLKTKKQIFALTLINQNHVFIPNSLLNLKKMNDFPNGERVVSIKSIGLLTNEEIVFYGGCRRSDLI